jgi:hypothetical protein
VSIDSYTPFVYGAPKFVNQIANETLLASSIITSRNRSFLNKSVFAVDPDVILLTDKPAVHDSLRDAQLKFVGELNGAKWVGDDLTLLTEDDIAIIKEFINI